MIRKGIIHEFMTASAVRVGIRPASFPPWSIVECSSHRRATHFRPDVAARCIVMSGGTFRSCSRDLESGDCGSWRSIRKVIQVFLRLPASSRSRIGFLGGGHFAVLLLLFAGIVLDFSRAFPSDGWIGDFKRSGRSDDAVVERNCVAEVSENPFHVEDAPYIRERRAILSSSIRSRPRSRGVPADSNACRSCTHRVSW